MIEQSATPQLPPVYPPYYRAQWACRACLSTCTAVMLFVALIAIVHFAHVNTSHLPIIGAIFLTSKMVLVALLVLATLASIVILFFAIDRENKRRPLVYSLALFARFCVIYDDLGFAEVVVFGEVVGFVENLDVVALGVVVGVVSVCVVILVGV